MVLMLKVIEKMLVMLKGDLRNATECDAGHAADIDGDPGNAADADGDSRNAAELEVIPKKVLEVI